MKYNFNELKEIVKSKMSLKRFTYTLGVVETSEKLAKIYNADIGEKIGDNPFLMIIGATFVVGAAKADDYYETTVAGIETGIKNLKDKKKKS